MKKRRPGKDLAIVAGIRTPFCKAGNALRGASASDLGAHAIREVLDRTGVPLDEVDEVILGCGGPDAREVNVARVAALRAGLPETTPAVTVMRNCASGMEAIFAAQQRLRAGDGEVFVVGGTESMSNFPLVMGPGLVRFFTRLGKARSPGQRLAALASFRLGALRPRIALVEGLTDPTTGMIMGSTAERIARRFGVGREEMDEYALQSHVRARAARDAGDLAHEIAPICAPPEFENALRHDDGIRDEQTIDALRKLRPVFDRENGDVTVGNSCQVTDGAAVLLCMSQSKARALGLEPIAIVRGHATAALSPADMGLGPVHATPVALDRAGIDFEQVDRVELNEAFAGQVLACMRAYGSAEYCRDALGLPAAIGEIDPAKLNANGGAIAIGHPIGATGARLVLTLARQLRQGAGGFGLATLCIGGGQGQSIVLEAA